MLAAFSLDAGAKTAAPAPPNAQSVPQQMRLSFHEPWANYCRKGQDANAKQVCFTGIDGRNESGQPVVAAVIIDPEGESKKFCV